MQLVILMGASGSGKTTIAEAIRIRRPDLAEVLHFDSIGVPSPEEGLACGPVGAWQRAMSLSWMDVELDGSDLGHAWRASSGAVRGGDAARVCAGGFARGGHH